MVLFYWDARDGRELSGWWFGDKIGGGQVWSHNDSTGQTPPATGWQCPVDGPVQEFVLCVPKLAPKEELGNGKEAGKRSAPKTTPEDRPAKRPFHVGEVADHTLVASSKAGVDAPAAVRTIVGEYVEEGTNHGRRTYLRKGNDSDAPIWLYYWDQRDGRNSSGWWFGDRVGSQQAFAHCQAQSVNPPPRGWRIPHDATIRTDFTVVANSPEEEADIPEQDRIFKVKDMVAQVEKTAESAIETARTVLDTEGDVFEESVRAVSELLDGKQASLLAARTSLVRHGAAARKGKLSATIDAEMSLLEERMESILGRLTKEQQRARERLERLETEGAEERDMKTIEDRLGPATEAVAQAGMAANAATTPDAAAKTRRLVESARMQVCATLDAARNFAPHAQEVANKAFGELLAKCQHAERRLGGWADQDPGQVEGLEAAADEEWAADLEGLETVLASHGEVADNDDELDVSDIDLRQGKGERELVFEATSRVEAEEIAARAALSTARAVLKEGVDERGKKVVQDLLEENLLAVRKTQKVLSREIAAGDRRMDISNIDSLAALAPRLRVIRSHLEEELGRARRHREKGSAMNIAETVGGAEELVEAVVSLGGSRRKRADLSLGLSGDRGADAKKFMDDFVISVNKAQGAIATARRRLDAQIRTARTLPSPQQKVMFAEIAPLRRRLIESQKKLNPHRKARVEYEQQLQAKQAQESFIGQFEALEADIAKMEGALKDRGVADVKSAEEWRRTTAEQLSKITAFFEKKAVDASGAKLQQILACQARCRDAQRRVERLSSSAQDKEQSLVVDGILADLEAKTKESEEWVQKIAKVENPWTGVEVLPQDQGQSALQAADALAKTAEPAVRGIKALVSQKLVSVNTMPEGDTRVQTIEGLLKLQARVDAVALRITQLKVDTHARRTAMLMPEVIKSVLEAEAKFMVVSEAARPLVEDILEKPETEAIKKACDKTLITEKDAQRTFRAARQALEAKKKDPRARLSPAFQSQLRRYEQRFEKVEREMAALKIVAIDLDKEKQRLAEQKKEADCLSKHIDEVELASLSLGNERPTDEAEESMALSIQAAEEKFRTWAAGAHSLEKSGRAAMQLAMQRVTAIGANMGTRITALLAETESRRGTALGRIFLREAQQRADKLEDALKKSREAGASVDESEAATVKLQSNLDELNAYVDTKRREILACHVAFPAEFDSLTKRTDAVLRALGAFREETASRKRAPPQVTEPEPKAAKLAA